MTEEATREGVSEATEQDAPKQPVKSRRDSAYEALIAARKAEKRESEPVVDENEEGEDSPQEPEVPMVEFLVDGEVVKVPANAKYRAKIDGQDVEQTVENITRSYQKGAAADRRLEEATRRSREAEQKAAQLAAKETELTEKEKAFVAKMDAAQKQREEGDLSEDDFQDVAKAFIDSLADEDQESMVKKVAQVFAKVGKKPQPVNIDKDALLAEAENRALRKIESLEAQREADRQTAEMASANEWFRSEFSDIVNDKRLMGAARAEAEAIKAENPGLSQREVAKRVGENIRQWTGKMKKPPTPPPVPKSASSRASVGADKPPLTRQETLNTMRAARGQPRL